MKKIMFIAIGSLFLGHAVAKNAVMEKRQQNFPDLILLDDIKPSYMANAVSGDFRSNWFIFLHGGITDFVGYPLGCGDFSSRMKPMLHIGFGKWITPRFGVRLSFQGFQFQKSGQTLEERLSRNYQNYHADFFLNVADYFHSKTTILPRWDFSPYIGFGLINNSSTHQRPFACSYGFFTRYRLSKRIYLSVEAGNTTTFSHFDGHGSEKRFGDHLLQGSVGMDITIGRVGWRHAVRTTTANSEGDDAVRKIVDNHVEIVRDTFRRVPYSGLESLKHRMYGQDPKEESAAVDVPPVSIDTKVGSPVYFFFRKNTYRLIDRAQMVNLNKMAKIIIRKHLKVRIYGAADDYTGTDRRNIVLSKQRAGYIAVLLHRRGVHTRQITRQSEGGVKYYTPIHANRFACVELYEEKY